MSTKTLFDRRHLFFPFIIIENNGNIVISNNLKGVILMTKYNESFDVDDIPKECPICHHEFDFEEDVDNNYHEDGIRAMLHCPKCKFKKALSFITNEDADQEYNEFMNGVDEDEKNEY
jgi:uncharacterized protein YbaR (Trm112 family)